MGCHSIRKGSKATKWQCIPNCGACCKLDPIERTEALEALNADQQKVFMDMVLPNGWCRNFDSGSRTCRIYNERPDFCRVSCIGSLFSIPITDIDDFAIKCCKQQIRSVYGGRSLVMRKFTKAIRKGIKDHG